MCATNPANLILLELVTLMLRRVALVITDVSEELRASFMKGTRIGSAILVTLMIEALRSSETSVLIRVTRRNIPEDPILHSHRRENLKSYMDSMCFLCSRNWLYQYYSEWTGFTRTDVTRGQMACWVTFVREFLTSSGESVRHFSILFVRSLFTRWKVDSLVVRLECIFLKKENVHLTTCFGLFGHHHVFIKCICYIKKTGPSLWSSGQTSWLQTQWSRVRFPALPDFLSSSGSGTGSTHSREDKWGATWKRSSGSGLENWD
jgi:hypothetical protein